MSSILQTVLTDATVRDEAAIRAALVRELQAGTPWYNKEA